MATAQRRTQGSIPRLGFGRERRIRLGSCGGGVENLAFDVAQRIARSAPPVLLECPRAQVARDIRD